MIFAALQGVGIFTLIILSSIFVLAKECKGQFVNPISDVCWECLFPMTLGSFEIYDSGIGKDTKNPDSPICLCSNPIRMGFVGGYWEPFRLVDVSHEPYCFVNMGGMKIDVGFEKNMGTRSKASSNKISRWYVHYYIYPLLAWLEIFSDFICMESSAFDIAYISELDPQGMDDELSLLIHPESFLYNNVTAQGACAADCLSANAGSARDELHWCSGCQGNMYPMNGNVTAQIGGVQGSVNVAQRIVYKMHRTGLAEETAAQTIKEVCNKRKSLMMKKSTYRYQMVNPNPDECQPFGKSTMFFEANKEVPYIGEDFGYLIWRKRNCCIF
jgi:conjugal transfer pilus assembly protein TraU